MIKLISFDKTKVVVKRIDNDLTVTFKLSDCTLNNDFIYSPPLEIINNASHGFGIFGSIEYQDFCKTYMENVLNDEQILTEANNRNLNITNKSTSDLIFDIVSHECSIHDTQFLLKVENSGLNIKAQSIEKKTRKKRNDKL